MSFLLLLTVCGFQCYLLNVTDTAHMRTVLALTPMELSQ